VSFLQYHLFLPSYTSVLQAISKEMPGAAINVNDNCDVDVAIVRAGYQSKQNTKKKLIFSFMSDI